MATEEMRNQAIAKLEGIVEHWQGDTADDDLVRSIIGSMRMLIESAALNRDKNETLHPLIVAIFIRSFTEQMQHIKTLALLTDLKKRGE